MEKPVIYQTILVDYDKDSDLALLTMVFKREADSNAAQEMTGFGSGLKFEPNDPAWAGCHFGRLCISADFEICAFR